VTNPEHHRKLERLYAMPDWSIDEILAVHFRMHKTEGVLFRDALARGDRVQPASGRDSRETALRSRGTNPRRAAEHVDETDRDAR
jgi:hypothetical protein